VTPIPGPIFLLALPLVAALVAYLVRRWEAAAAVVSALATASLALLCARLPLDRSAFVLGQEVAFGRPVVLAGRTLMLDPAGQSWLAFLFALATLSFLLAWRLRQGRLFFSISLVILSLYVLVALLQTFSLAILVLAMSATPGVFLIQGDRPGSVQGGQRYLLVTLLAVPLLLSAAWLVGQAQLAPENAEMARLALLPAALGFGFLLAVFPFGTWMPALAADAPPMASAFLFTAGQAAAVFLVLMFLHEAAWPLHDAAALEVLQVAGLVTVVAGGLMAAAQRDFGRLFGYATLSDLGYLLLAFGVGGSQAVVLALLHVANRSVPIVLMAACVAVLRNRTGSDAFSRLRGVARRLPIATTGLLIGGLALAGWPMTAGFATHWGIGRAVASAHWSWVLLLLASSGGIVIGLLRGLSSMLGEEPRADIPRQPIMASVLIVIVAGLVISLGLYPQLFLPSIQRAVEAFALF
jgi:formate hydrogenlyase subunit 3/multisubunit Na+/H+ antiporter MnhD subunit